MSLVNIGGDPNDPSYRYRRPRVQVHQEGRGNGVRVRFMNCVEIAKALKVPASWLCKWLGYELGAQSRWKESIGEALINGTHKAADFEASLLNFIDQFVLCPTCGLPETYLKVPKKKKSGTITVDCQACGHNGPLQSTHKLCGFIMKNPPPKRKRVGRPARDDDDDDEAGGMGAASSAATTNTAMTEEERIRRAAADAAGADDEDDPFNSNIVDVSQAVIQDEDDVQWSTEVSEAAVLARQKEQIGESKLLSDMSAATIKRDIVQSAEAFAEWFSAQGGKDDTEVPDILTFLHDLGATYTHSPLEILGVFCEVCWDEDVLNSVEHYMPIYTEYVVNTKAQKLLLGNIERVCGVKYEDTLFKYSPHIVKAFYDADLLDEEVILKWAKKGSSKYVKNEVSKRVKKACEALVQWLEQAESDSYDSDYDESGDASASASGGAAQPAAAVTTSIASSTAAAAGDDEDSDSFDIDDI